MYFLKIQSPQFHEICQLYTYFFLFKTVLGWRWNRYMLHWTRINTLQRHSSFYKAHNCLHIFIFQFKEMWMLNLSCWFCDVVSNPDFTKKVKNKCTAGSAASVCASVNINTRLQNICDVYVLKFQADPHSPTQLFSLFR